MFLKQVLIKNIMHWREFRIVEAKSVDFNFKLMMVFIKRTIVKSVVNRADLASLI